MIFVHFLPFLFFPIPLIPFMVLQNFPGLASCSSSLSLTNSSFATARCFFYFIFLMPENFPVLFRWKFPSFIEEEVLLMDFTNQVFSYPLGSVFSNFLVLEGGMEIGGFIYYLNNYVSHISSGLFSSRF